MDSENQKVAMFGVPQDVKINSSDGPPGKRI
jgi:hypothetical protein